MFTLNVKADVSQAVAQLNRIKAGLGDKAISRSLNDTAAKVKTAMIANITSEYNIKAADVRELIGQTKAVATGQRFTAIITGNPYGRRRRALNVTRFIDVKTTVRSLRKGSTGLKPILHARIKRRGAASAISGAFVLNVPGNPVVARDGRKLVGVLTIGVPQMFNAKRVQQPVQRAIPSWFAEIFARNVRHYLSTIK